MLNLVLLLSSNQLFLNQSHHQLVTVLEFTTLAGYLVVSSAASLHHTKLALL